MGTKAEEQVKIDNLEKALQIHCAQNELRDKMNDEKLDKLMPLADLIPTINELVESQRATVYMSRKFLKFVGYVSSVIGLLYLILTFWKELPTR